MAKWLRRLGHRVTVLTTSAYGTGRAAPTRRTSCPHARPAAPARAAARPRSRGRPVRLRHLLGQAAPAQQGARARAADRRLGAVCALAGAAAQSPRALRLRDHQLAARVGPRRGPGACAARRRLGRRPSRRLDLRADPAALPHRAPAPPRRAPRAPLADARPTRSSASAARPPRTCASASGSSRRLVPNGWDPDLVEPGRAGRRRWHPGPGAHLARLHGPLRQLRARPRARWSEPWASWPAPTLSRPRGSSWSSRAP